MHDRLTTRTPTRATVGRALTAWHASVERHVAIRAASEPWPILVAEVMSQQTQVERIGPAWALFVGRWPTPSALADADTHALLQAWAGLGYNRRALALRAAAQAIVRDHRGRVPDTVVELEALPGVGPYTARAVAATAFGVPVAPLDVNVRRVIDRLFGEAVNGATVQATADDLVSRRDPRAWLTAVMDLAALVCTRRNPRCDACPVRSMCRSRGTPGEERSERVMPRFSSTNRWLRGRLLARVREAPPGTWIDAPERLGEHGPTAIRAALQGLVADGFVEVRDGLVRLR